MNAPSSALAQIAAAKEVALSHSPDSLIVFLNSSEGARIYIPELVKLLTAISWPLAVLLICVLFKWQIRDFLNRIEKLVWGDKQVTLSNALQQASRLANEVIPSTLTVGSVNRGKRSNVGEPENLASTEQDTKLNDDDARKSPAPHREETAKENFKLLGHIAASAPRTAILESWRQLESLAEYSCFRDPINMVSSLEGVSALPKGSRQLVAQLKSIREQAISLSDISIPPEEAIRYVELAQLAHMFIFASAEDSHKMRYDK